LKRKYKYVFSVSEPLAGEYSDNYYYWSFYSV